MKMIFLLFFTLVLISCGPSREAYTVCQGLNNLETCTELGSQKRVGRCSSGVIQSILQELEGTNSPALPDQKAGFQEASDAYGTCVDTALDLEKASEKDKISILKDCANSFAVQGRKTLGCI